MSEYGKGFAYCLALFMAHQHYFRDQKVDGIKDSTSSNMWFSGASDHLFELEIPESFVLKDSCEAWRETILDWGHGVHSFSENRTDKDISWALDKCKEFLLAWDKQCGIKTEKGDYE